MLNPIDLRIDEEMKDPEFRRAYYDVEYEMVVKRWRLEIGWLGQIFNAITFGWWAERVLRRPKPTVGDIDANIQAKIVVDAATRSNGPSTARQPSGDAE